MSPQSSKKKKARADRPPAAMDVYVGLLLLSVAALISGIICLKFQLDAYL